MKNLLISLACMTASCAAEPVAKTYSAPDGTEVLYRLASPEKTEPGKKYPLVLFLHGSGERGTDNTAQMKHGVPAILAGAEKLNEPVFLIAPQCPPEQWWSEPKEDRMELKDAGGKNPLIDAVLALVAETARRFREHRVAVDFGTTYWIRVGAATGILAISLQSLVEFSLQMPGNTMMFAVLWAMAITPTPRPFTRNIFPSMIAT